MPYEDLEEGDVDETYESPTEDEVSQREKDRNRLAASAPGMFIIPADR